MIPFSFLSGLPQELNQILLIILSNSPSGCCATAPKEQKQRGTNTSPCSIMPSAGVVLGKSTTKSTDLLNNVLMKSTKNALHFLTKNTVLGAMMLTMFINWYKHIVV